MAEQRYPLSVRMVGVLHKGKSKVSAAGSCVNPTRTLLLSAGNIRPLLLQMYVVSVLWSDQDDLVIYRTMREFKKAHVSCCFHPSLQVARASPGGSSGLFSSMTRAVLPHLQKQMKKAFPPASKLKKSDRILPRFRGTCA